LEEPVRLAESLLDSGISGMKIWPFDPIAKVTGGNYITPLQIKEGLAASGDQGEIWRFHGSGHGVSWLLEFAVRDSDCAGV
jgi:hypothetical protein